MKSTEAPIPCDYVVNSIIDKIANHEYGIGEKLPPERTMATMYNVSRTTIRESMKVLNCMGFVDSTQGSGNYITDKYDQTVTNIMRIMFLRGDIDYDGFTKFRQMLELQSFELAVENATDIQKEEMKQIVDLLDIVQDDALMIKLDNRFHTILAEASQNSLILINFSALSKVIDQYMHNTYHRSVAKKEDGYKRLQIYHHAIVDALIDKDLEKGRQAIIDHFNWIV